MTDDVPRITPATLHERIETGDGACVLDIRDRKAVEQWRIDGDGVSYTHVPRSKVLQAKALGEIDELVDGIDGDGEITVVCGEGAASAEVASFLTDAGYDAANLADGMDGWGDLYLAAELPVEGVSSVVQYRRPSSGCLSYLVVSGGEAAVIDPLEAFTDRYVEDADAVDAALQYAIDTHVHADHVSGVRTLAAHTDATPIVPTGARERGVEFETETVGDGETLPVGDLRLSAVAAPGHTTDMTAFVVANVLLSGDSLFVESVARPDLERDGDGAAELARQLYETLRDRFGTLPEDTLVAPGHYGEAAGPGSDGIYTARLGDLRERLWPFEVDESSFVEGVLADLPPTPANYDRIIAVNLGRERAETDEILELELGPNNCAVAE